MSARAGSRTRVAGRRHAATAAMALALLAGTARADPAAEVRAAVRPLPRGPRRPGRCRRGGPGHAGEPRLPRAPARSGPRGAARAGGGAADHRPPDGVPPAPRVHRRRAAPALRRRPDPHRRRGGLEQPEDPRSRSRWPRWSSRPARPSPPRPAPASPCRCASSFIPAAGAGSSTCRSSPAAPRMRSRPRCGSGRSAPGVELEHGHALGDRGHLGASGRQGSVAAAGTGLDARTMAWTFRLHRQPRRRHRPARLTPPLTALWHAARGEWDTAHDIAQQREGEPAHDWVHAHLHRVEGDLGNADYWYRRPAGRCRRRSRRRAGCDRDGPARPGLSRQFSAATAPSPGRSPPSVARWPRRAMARFEQIAVLRAHAVVEFPGQVVELHELLRQVAARVGKVDSRRGASLFLRVPLCQPDELRITAAPAGAVTRTSPG